MIRFLFKVYMDICQNCNGEKKMLGFFPIYKDSVPYSERKIAEMMPCVYCDGTGYVPKGHDERQDLADKLREFRLKNEMTMRKFCAKYEIDVNTISRVQLCKSIGYFKRKKIKRIIEEI